MQPLTFTDTLFVLNIVGWFFAIYFNHKCYKLTDLLESRNLIILFERDRADTKAAQLRKICKDPTLAECQMLIASIKQKELA